MEERGSIMLETVISFLVLLVIAFACIETTFLITDKVYLQRVVREAAREGAIERSVSAGRAKGNDLVNMYFSEKAHKVSLDVKKREEDSGANKMAYITANAVMPHKVFGPQMEVNLHARATFGWWDPSL